MDNVIKLYNEKKLIVRAMDVPTVRRENEELMYDCSTWANEFELMQLEKFSSVSSTLIVPNVPVKLYKNVGFLVNANTTDCFHICKTDSGSSGNVNSDDFYANTPDFDNISELGNYIESTNATDMNEVNLNLKLNDVVGLVITKCQVEPMLLKRMIVVQKVLEQLTNNQYHIYEYDSTKGNLNKINLTDDLIEEICESFSDSKIDNTNSFCYYTDSSDEIFYGNMNDTMTL